MVSFILCEFHLNEKKKKKVTGLTKDMSISWLALIPYLLNVEMLTDIVAVLKLKCGIDALIFFAITVGINREIMI